jgi:hypothetical protein
MIGSLAAYGDGGGGSGGTYWVVVVVVAAVVIAAGSWLFVGCAVAQPIERTRVLVHPSRSEAVRLSLSRLTAPLALFALLAGACSSSSGGSSSPTSSPRSASTLAPVHGTYSPSIDPANFVKTIDNPYWPLEPGTTYTYDGVRGTTPQTDVEVVSYQTKVILGIRSTVVQGHGLRARCPGGADLRLVRPGRGRQRLVHG